MLAQDLRFAWRTLFARPSFTLIALFTLALGLGANTAMFSVMRAVLMRPLPYPSPAELVKIVGRNRATNGTANLSPADFMDFARESQTLERMGAHGWIGYFTVADSTGVPERIGGVNVTEGFFPTLGASFALGRSFTRDEDAPNGPRVVVLSHGFWRRRYGGDPSIVGRAIEVNARPATVVGVLASGYRHVEANPEREADLYMPYQFATANPNRGGHFIRAVGRLAAGRTADDAAAELAAIAARLERSYPTDNTNQSVSVAALHRAMVAETRPALLLLGGAVGFVLLVACANLANLLLARGAGRRTEMAIRAAMGAGRGRLMRQMLTESVLLSALGALAAIAMAVASTGALRTLAGAGVPRAEDIAVDGAVLMFALLLALVTGVMSGLVPALRISRGELHLAVREGARGQSRPAMHRPVRELLIASQIAVALTLLTGAGLMLRSLSQLMNVETGFSGGQVLTFETAVPTATYAEGDQIPFYERFYEVIRRQPGVDAVGAINILPLSANYDSRGIQIDSRPMPVGQSPSIQARSISPDYFRAMEIPLLSGRAFTDADREGTPRVVIISESMARRYWPNESPIGQRLTFNSGIPEAEQQPVGGAGSREIVGVVGDVKHLGLDEDEVPMFYTPQAQQPSYHTMAVIVRATTDAASLAGAIRSELARLDRGVPLYRVRTLDTIVDAVVAIPRVRAWLFGIFAALALALSAIGVFGVVGYLVGERRHEIGVRLALGAKPGSVLRRMLLEAMRPVAFGIVAGLATSFAAARLISQMLYGVSAIDATTYLGVVALLCLVAAAAIYIPSRRVLTVEPMSALRTDC